MLAGEGKIVSVGGKDASETSSVRSGLHTVPNAAIHEQLELV